MKAEQVAYGIKFEDDPQKALRLVKNYGKQIAEEQRLCCAKHFVDSAKDGTYKGQTESILNAPEPEL